MTGPFRFVRHPSAQAFLDRAGVWLMLREAEHNLILALGAGWAELDVPLGEGEDALLFATVEQGDEVVGCAIRTPPFKPILTRLPGDAIPTVVEGCAGVYSAIPAVMGPPAVARTFAEHWVALKGGGFEAGDAMGIYELVQVIHPTDPPDGGMRAATPADVPLVAQWLQAFMDETHLPAGDPLEMAHRFAAESRAFLWDHGGPVSLAVISGETPSGVRIGYVYTPPSQRGLGLASAVTAALSQHCLDAGSRACFLYTDLRNPTSNRIYQAIGYRPVAEAADFNFTERESP